MRLPLRSSNGSRPKSRLIDRFQLKGLGRGLELCPRMLNTAAELFRDARGANSPNERTACSYSFGMCAIQAEMNSSGVSRTILRQCCFLSLAQNWISSVLIPVIRRCAIGGRLA